MARTHLQRRSKRRTTRLLPLCVRVRAVTAPALLPVLSVRAYVIGYMALLVVLCLCVLIWWGVLCVIYWGAGLLSGCFK